MKCIDVKENLDAFADGETEISQAREIERHLENCAACRAGFKNLQAIRESLKQILRVSAPAFLDEKVMSEFQTFHKEKRARKTEETQKAGWFGIPRFALAAVLVLFALATISAFQIGRMSAGEINVVMPEAQENSISNKMRRDSEENIKIVEVPVIREKIVEVPMIREKVVTKTVYINKNEKPQINFPAREDFELKNKVEDNKYLTRSNLEGFQPVSEMNLRISKEANQK